MRTIMLLTTGCIAAGMLCGCRSSGSKSAPPPAVPKSVLKYNFRWPVPTGLPVFGTASTNTICIVIYGGVNRPGYYFLPAGAVVGDAVKAAQGLKGEWTGYTGRLPSGIVRPNIFRAEVVQFTRGAEKEEQVPLKDGDQIHFGVPGPY